MAKPAKDFTVSLSFDAPSNSWTMSNGNGAPVAPKAFPPIVVPKAYEGHITFNIASPGVTFATANPMLAAPVSNGGTKPISLDPQFTITRSGDGKSLVVHDLNGVPGHPQQGYNATDYQYLLNFEGAPPIDPIISNGGCCKPTNNLMYYALGAIAVIALLVLVLRPMLNRRNSNAARDRDTA